MCFNPPIKHVTNQNKILSSDLIIGGNPYHSEKYLKAFRKSIDEPEEFWAEVGKCVTWDTPWTRVLDDSEQPFTKW